MYTLLILDDEKAIVDGLLNIIDWEGLGCRVADVAYDGQRGLELIMSLQPDIVISDIRMPLMDGLQMIEQARKQGFDNPILLLSGYSEFEYARRAMQYGVKSFLVKPIEEEELVASVRSAIAEIAKKREIQQLLNTINLPGEAAAIQAKLSLIEQIKAYIREQEGNVSLSSVAEAFYMHPQYLSQLFKKKGGDTYSSFVNEIKMDKAKQLLLHTDLKIYEIAAQIGFDDVKYFSKLFEKTVGQKPSEFRQSGDSPPVCP